jgi:membrane protein
MSATDGPPDRSRLSRTLTFWLRPAFALRVVNRFQKIVGFDRSMALASSALTALVPLALLISTVLGFSGRPNLAERIITRYGLTGGGAEAVRTLFSFGHGTDASLSVLGAVFLVISALSFARAAQRLIEQTWDLVPLSVRNTANDLLWLASLGLYLTAVGWLYAELSSGRLELVASLCEAPVTAVFLQWSGWLLSARRQGWRPQLPFAVLGGVLYAIYLAGANIYLPRLFSSYATRYGPVGAVFAMITALFGGMLVLVGSAALGREIVDELDRIRRGQRPADDEVRREWDGVIARMRGRWRSAQKGLARRRGSSRKRPR